VLRFLIGQIENVEITYLVTFGPNFTPSPIQMQSKPGLKTYIVLKDKYVRMLTRRNSSPDSDV
jgi:hypothetical protein